MTFILLAILMIAVAAACVVFPLWRGHVSYGKISAAEAGQGVYQRQLAELERDLANGLLAESDYQSAVRDIERERLSNQPKTAPQFQLAARNGKLLGIAVGVLIMIVAGLFYWRMGNWRVATEGTDAASRIAIEDMVQNLADRLHTKDQNDLQGWLMLGHSYIIMERYQDAVAAFEHARKLAGDDNAEVLAAYAEAVTLADPDHFMQQAAPLFEKVLKLDPDNVKALWYGGLAASQQGDNKLAVKRWQNLLKQNLPEDYAAFVSKYIKQAGGTIPAVAVAKTATTIHVHVALNPALKAELAPDETVFVFARPSGAQGGPPLAVRRLQVRDLPLDVTLSDKDAMISGRSLADFDSIQLVARVSKDGSPLPKPGEPSGTVVWKRGKSAGTVRVTINSAVR